MKSVYRYLVMGLALVLVACQSDTSLQKYYVKHQNDKNFVVIDLPASMVFSQIDHLPKEAHKALKSIKKANVLALPLNGSNQKQYERERRKLMRILKTDDYKLLFKLKYEGKSFQLLYEGDPEAIEEFVVMAYADDKGFVVARLLGDHMNPEAIMQALGMAKKGKLSIDMDTIEQAFDDLN